MTHFDTPQAAEDAYYDALDDGNLEALMSVWADLPEACCLLPMQPLRQGLAAIREAYAPLLSNGRTLEISVTHLSWIESGDMAAHLIEERTPAPPGQPAMGVYATNLYRRDADGWRLVAHQNAPMPPPPGMRLPPQGAPG